MAMTYTWKQFSHADRGSCCGEAAYQSETPFRGVCRRGRAADGCTSLHAPRHSGIAFSLHWLQVFLDGDAARNRALEGDLVAVELADFTEWVRRQAPVDGKSTAGHAQVGQGAGAGSGAGAGARASTGAGATAGAGEAEGPGGAAGGPADDATRATVVAKLWQPAVDTTECTLHMLVPPVQW